MNAATGQKIGLGNVNGGVQGVGGLTVASNAINGPGVLGVGMNNLNDPSKGM